jgi:hypothetical protein
MENTSGKLADASDIVLAIEKLNQTNQNLNLTKTNLFQSSTDLLTVEIPFPPNSGAFLEGLPDSTRKPVIDRTVLVNKISDKMKNQMSLLITSPSFTGKTSLANLMYNHWQQSGKTVYFISFSLYNIGDDLNQFFKKILGKEIIDIMRLNGYLILDETQNIYRHPTFWGGLKSGAQVCKVLAFGVFGLSTAGYDRSPSQFQEKWYYDDVNFI